MYHSLQLNHILQYPQDKIYYSEVYTEVLMKL